MTGASPAIPTIPGLETADYLTAETIIGSDTSAKNVDGNGAGATGVQLAELFAIFGTKVYLLESKNAFCRNKTTKFRRLDDQRGR